MVVSYTITFHLTGGAVEIGVYFSQIIIGYVSITLMIQCASVDNARGRRMMAEEDSPSSSLLPPISASATVGTRPLLAFRCFPSLQLPVHR